MLITHSVLSSSPLFDNLSNPMLRFYADWTVQFLMSVFYFLMIFASLSFFIGVCLYIGAMASDLRVQVASVVRATTKTQQFVGEISFHIEILEFA